VEDDDEEVVRSFRNDSLRRFLEPSSTYIFTRFVFLRLVGLVYLIAFFSLARQIGPLLGRDGLLPATQFLDRVLALARGSYGAAFGRVPTLFWLGASDTALAAVCWAGVALSFAVSLGVTNAVVQFVLWAMYLSLVRIGQVFYGYGWELQLLETGFLAIFLCPVRSLGPFPASPPSTVVILLLRWLTFRIMVGAGLIKLRGDPCWRDLTCLFYHYETQPLPNPVSYLLHQLPLPFHRMGVLFNHFVELVVPWFAFGPRRARHVAGVFLVAFQLFLILSGNLSFLNWLTLAPALACFDDRILGKLFPSHLRTRLLHEASSLTPSRLQRGVSYTLALVVLVLSIQPVLNLFSRRQAMNATFDRLGLVNTYGAFGAVGKQRFEVILQGTHDETPDESARWLDYELPCKPGDVNRRPCAMAPYHYRLDWQIWFAAFSSYDQEPWIVHLTYKLLLGDRGVMRLLDNDPFPDKPPKYIRAELYRYEFTRIGDGSGAWWRRKRVAEYMPPVSVDDPGLLDFVQAYGWLRGGENAPEANAP
jgi:hypothetical protein